MLSPWRQYGDDRGTAHLNFCERCGAVVDGDPDSSLDLKFVGKHNKTRCADDVINAAAEELENG